MIVHNRDERKDLAGGLGKLRNWAQRHKLLLQLVALGAVFAMGVLAQWQGLIGQLRIEIGLTGKNLAVMKSVAREPGIALDALRNAQLPTLYIDMGFNSLQRIEAKRDEALQLGLLLTSDDDFVPAEIRFQDRTIRVKIRLKGDLMDHLVTEKWSYRIHVKDDDQLFGMRRFSIQHPGTRKYLLEWGWLENLRRDGVLAPRYQFVQVVFNGAPKGIYALEEHFSKELLESQQRRESVIIRFDESGFWERYAQLGDSPAWHDFVTNVNDYRNASIKTSRTARVDADLTLSIEREAAVGLLRGFQEGNSPASEVFDAALLGRFLAISELWHAYHGLYWNNMHFYYNPISAKLEPIGFDGTPDPSRTSQLYAPSFPWLIQALNDPVIAESYVRELDRISQPEYLEQLRHQLDAPLEQLQLALYREFPDVYSTPVWKLLARRQDYIRHSLDSPSMVLASVSHYSRVQDPDDSNDTMEIDVRNILALPVEVLGFQLGDSFIPAQQAWRGSEADTGAYDGRSAIVLAGNQQGNDDPVRYASFEVPVDAVNIQVEANQLPDVKVVTRLLGMSTTSETPVHQYPQALTSAPLPSMPTVQQALARHSFLEQGGTEATLVVREGVWDVTSDLVLPRGVALQVGPGTTLRFASDAIMVSTGPLEFRGTAEAPVELVPMNGSWEGLAVIEAKEPSIWENVVVKNTTGITRDGWILTGGITFYESPIYLVRSRILGSEAEDGINIIRSLFEFRECEFAGFASDAFDGDFTQGTIQTCSFHDTQGDAIDLSGSQVSVNDVVLRNIGDKGISAGEASHVNARDLLASELGIGVASKDLSHVELQRVKIEDAIHAGLAAYEKKQEYGPASINAVEVELNKLPQEALVQIGSWIKLNGLNVEESQIDVEALYTAGIQGN